MKLKKKDSFTSGELAALIGGELSGAADLLITGLNGIEHATEGDLTFYASDKYKSHFEKSSAACIIISKEEEFTSKPNQAYIAVDAPYREFVKVLIHLDSKLNKILNRSRSASFIAKSARIAESATLYEGCYIGENVSIGENTVIMPSAVIMDDSEIGSDCRIYPNVTLYYGTKIGNKCIIHAGAVVGSDGFGFLEDEYGCYHKIPQLGNVEIGDDCEIGANSTIDRATVGTTLLASGVKLDNLVHVAHNVEVGENTGVAAQAGISGSVKLGKRTRLGGQTGIAGHLELGDDVSLLAQSGTAKSLLNKGVYFGSPAKEQRKAFRIEAALRHLPDLIREVAELKKMLYDRN